jgi:hypothetical protein
VRRLSLLFLFAVAACGGSKIELGVDGGVDPAGSAAAVGSVELTPSDGGLDLTVGALAIAMVVPVGMLRRRAASTRRRATAVA